MNVVTTMPAALCREVVPLHPDEPTAPRTNGDRQPTSRGAADLLLVFGTVAMVLGLAAVTASLRPEAAGRGEPVQNWAPISIDRDLASVVQPDIAEHFLAEPPTPTDVADEPDPPALPHVSDTGPWKSPLYPQNHVTLWDRIRVSSPRDRRAQLLGAAIQTHAPETAATPGPRSGLTGEGKAS